MRKHHELFIKFLLALEWNILQRKYCYMDSTHHLFIIICRSYAADMLTRLEENYISEKISKTHLLDECTCYHTYINSNIFKLIFIIKYRNKILFWKKILKKNICEFLISISTKSAHFKCENFSFNLRIFKRIYAIAILLYTTRYVYYIIYDQSDQYVKH